MFDSILTGSLTLAEAMGCTAVSLTLGALAAAVCKLQGKRSGSLLVSLMILPALVQMVIMLVNGNLGAGVAVAGAFSLVRFRSVPGDSRDILFIFYSMAIGLATGMGYLLFALVFAAVIGLVLLLAGYLFGRAGDSEDKRLAVTIPEDLDYTGCFDDLFEKYLKKSELEQVKTTNMGTLFNLTYRVLLRDPSSEKELIDAIRCRNGNLSVSCGRFQPTGETL